MPDLILRDGERTQVDADVLAWASQFKWHVNHNGYVTRHGKKGTKPRYHFLHREIMQPAAHLVVDHINGDPLDNRRANLRVCTRGENLRNQRPGRGATSVFKGVRRLDYNGTIRWMARITVDGHMHFLGNHATEVEAARAYDVAARKCFGEFARFNLPTTSAA